MKFHAQLRQSLKTRFPAYQGKTRRPSLKRQRAPEILTARELLAAEEAHLRRLRRTAAEAPDREERETLVREAAETAGGLEPPPPEPCLLAADVTQEGLAARLAEQGGRLAVFDTEGSVFSIALGRYTSGASNFEVLLRGWSADSLRVDRKGSSPIRVERPVLTVCVTLQPEVLRRLGEKRETVTQGLMSRFLFAIPDSRVGSRLFVHRPEPGRFLDPLEPDLLGEELVMEVLSQDPQLAGRVLDAADEGGASQTLTVLTRLAQRLPEWRSSLRDSLAGRLDSLVNLALDVAVETGDPTGPVLAHLVETEGSPSSLREILRRCDDPAYERSVPLTEVAASATKRALEFHRSQPDQEDDDHRPEEARLLNNLGNLLSALGRREEALEATAEAVEIRRDLARSRPDAFLPDLASALNNLGLRLAELKRLSEAAAVSREAVATLAPFYLRYPEAFTDWMGWMVENYQRHAKDAGVGLDERLLDPLLTALRQASESVQDE